MKRVILFTCVFGIMLVSSAQAHTLSMSEIRRGITEAVRDQVHRTMVVRVFDCRRINAHGGRCMVQVYTPGAALPLWCGKGTAKLIGQSQYMRAHGTLRSCRRGDGRKVG